MGFLPSGRGLATSLIALALPLLSSCENSSRASAVAEAACDRACIVALTDAYVASLIAGETKHGLLADNARIVENLRRHDRDQKEWQAPIKGEVSFAVHVPDAKRSQAGWMGVVTHGNKPVVLAIRLRFDNKRVVEAEHLFADLADLTKRDLDAIYPELRSEIPARARKGDDELLRIGESYFNALDGNDGSLAPFSDQCKRIENGIRTAGTGATSPTEFDPYRPGVASDCRSQIDSQAFVFIDKIERRRMVGADPETGLVMGFARFRHSMDNLPYKVALEDGSTLEVTKDNLPYEPFDLATAHIFKVSPEGTITTISAVGVLAPYGAPSAWD